MLLTSLDLVKPGMTVGAIVLHPTSPDICLLMPGAEITETIIARLRGIGVSRLWVEHHLTRDLDEAVDLNVQRVKLGVYSRLKQDMQKLAQRSIGKSQLQSYRRAVINLVRELVTHRPFTGLADQLFDAGNQLISHGANVAYLATLVGLELERYVVSERPKLAPAQARNVVNLGLAGMLHDVGKVEIEDTAGLHEVLLEGPAREHHPYDGHPERGYDMLRKTEVPPTVRNVVLSHHRRFDGTGWPDMSKTLEGRRRPSPAGRRLHIFARIVSAVNVLDNLLQDADGNRRPPVAALHDFASRRFDGWFDPLVRLAALRRIPPFAVGSLVELSDGRAAVVTEPNELQPCRPTVRLLEESAGGDAAPPTLSLAQHPALTVRSCAGEDVTPWLFELAPPGRGDATRAA